MAPRIIVVGGGVIGASISYHLALLSHSCIIIEQSSIACAASGKSAGFLASNWSDTTPLTHLSHPSFHIHRQLSQQLSTDIGYRSLHSYSLSLIHPQSPTNTSNHSSPSTISWLDGPAQQVHPAQQIGSPQSTAIVHPYKLTHALIQNAARLSQSSVHIAKLEQVHKSSSNKVIAVSVRNPDGQLVRLPCDVLVLAMGPWSSQAISWFPSLPPVLSQKAASLVLNVKLPPTALFTEYVNHRGQLSHPEVYPREDQVYLCQSAVPDDLPSDPNAVTVAPTDVADLKHFASALSTKLASALTDDRNIVAQACNLPLSPDGLPIIGPIPHSHSSAYIATAHSCWGILNSPATGKAIAQLIVNGTSCIDISSFSPSRFT